MNNQYDNNLRGALFKNTKRMNENQPHATGSCEINGTEYWVSAWTKTDKNGNKYQSLSFTEKQSMESNSNGSSTSAPAKPDMEFDDDVPF